MAVGASYSWKEGLSRKILLWSVPREPPPERPELRAVLEEAVSASHPALL